MRLSTTAALTTLVALVAAAPLPKEHAEDNLVEAHEEGLLLLVPTLPADGSGDKQGNDIKKEVRACVCFVVLPVNPVPSIFLPFITFHFFVHSILSLYPNTLFTYPLPFFYSFYSLHPLRSIPFNYITFYLCVPHIYPSIPSPLNSLFPLPCILQSLYPFFPLFLRFLLHDPSTHSFIPRHRLSTS